MFSLCATFRGLASRFALLALLALPLRGQYGPAESGLALGYEHAYLSGLSLSPKRSWQTYPRSARGWVANRTFEDIACLFLGRVIGRRIGERGEA
jgi:hypothetical protein